MLGIQRYRYTIVCCYSHRYINILYLFIIFLLGLSNFATCEETETIIKNIQTKYSATKDFTINFKQIFIWRLAGTTDTVMGTIYWKKENYYKFQTLDKVISTDGKSVWSYSLFTNQTLIDNFHEEDELFLPRHVLFEFPDEYSTKYIGKEAIEKQYYYVLQMTPKSEDELFIQTLKVWIDPKTWLAKKVEYTDLRDNITIYIVEQIKLDQGLDESIFQFTPPTGSEAIDMRQ